MRMPQDLQIFQHLTHSNHWIRQFGNQKFGDFSNNKLEETSKPTNDNCRWGDAFQDAFSEPVNNASKPKEQKSANDPFSGQGRYTGLDFYEDPFKNSNYRYADPFDENSNSDPFNDPFTASESDVFGSDPFS